MTADLYIKRLLKRICSNDRQAFDLFFEYYYPRLLKFAVYYVKTYENAEDIVSDVMIKILKKKKELYKIENFNGYIFLAVRNQCLSFLSKKKPTSIELDDETDYLVIENHNPETDFLHQELLDSINKAIENLPVKRKKIYKLVKEQGLSYQNVADLLNISKKTVEVHMGLAISDIRKSVQDYLNDSNVSTPIRKIINIIILMIASSLFII